MKHIKFSGAPSEKSSPFCKKNEIICSAWEEYILSKEGRVVGKYNAFSLIVKAKLPYGWELEVKKSSMSNGNLILSTQFQNLFFHVQMKKKNLTNEPGYFIFKRKKFFHRLRKIFLVRGQQLDFMDNYFLEYEKINLDLYKGLKEILSKSIRLGQIKTLALIEGELEVTFDANTSDFEMIDQILVL